MLTGPQSRGPTKGKFYTRYFFKIFQKQKNHKFWTFCLRAHETLATALQTARNFKCPQCEKSFKTNRDLKQHSIVHSQTKNFECPKCGKLFKTNRDLQSHLRTHNNKRDFKCEICNKEFKRPDALKKHKRTHPDKKQ